MNDHIAVNIRGFKPRTAYRKALVSPLFVFNQFFNQNIIYLADTRLKPVLRNLSLYCLKFRRSRLGSLMIHPALHLFGGSSLLATERKATGPVTFYLVQEVLCVTSRLGSLSGETCKKGRTDAAFGKGIADCTHQADIRLIVPLAVHCVYHRIITGLKRNVKIRQKALVRLHKRQNIGIKMIRMNVQQTNPEIARQDGNLLHQPKQK